MSDLHDMSLKEIVRLTREEARREALEEAAQIADSAMRGAENAAGKAKLTTAILGHSGRAEFAERIALAIRALIDKETRHD